MYISIYVCTCACVCVCVCVCVCRCSPHWETSTLRGAWPTAWLLKGFLAGLCRSIYYLFPRVPASVSRICRGRGREREREGTPRRCLRLWRPAPTCSSSSCKARLLYSYVTCDDVTCDDVTCDDVTCDDVTCDSSTRSCCWRAHNLPRAYSLTWLLKVFGIFVCMCVWYVCVVCVCVYSRRTWCRWGVRSTWMSLIKLTPRTTRQAKSRARKWTNRIKANWSRNLQRISDTLATPWEPNMMGNTDKNTQSKVSLKSLSRIGTSSDTEFPHGKHQSVTLVY